MSILDWLLGRKTKQSAPPAIEPQEHFVREMENRLASEPGVKSVIRVPEQPMTLTVTCAAGEVVMYLGNLFHEIREMEPEAREMLVTRHLVTALRSRPSFKTFEEAEPRLAVALRGPLCGNPKDMELAARELVPCLREHLVIDGEGEISLVSTEQARGWTTPFDQAVETGRTRLRKANRGEVLYDEPQRIWTVETNDDYESSRLLLPGFLANFSERVNGRPIAVAPTRTQVFIAGDADPTVVLRLCTIATREFAASSRRVSAAIYTVDGDGRLIRYFREVNDAATLAVRASHVRFEGTEYTEQKAALDSHFETVGDDVFVASFSGIEFKERGLYSYCAWAPDVRALLPRTDLVALELEPQRVALVPWEATVRAAGPKLQLDERLYPYRWRTMGALEEAELQGLKEFEFDPARP